MKKRLKQIFAVALFVLSTAPSALFAHPVAQGAFDIEIFPDRILLTARVSTEEAFVSNTLAQSNDPPASLAEAYQRHGLYMLAHIHLMLANTELKGKLVSTQVPQGENKHIVYEINYPLPPKSESGKLKINENVLADIEYSPGTSWEASYVVWIGVHDGAHQEGLLLTSRAALEFAFGAGESQADQSALNTFFAYCLHGIIHILTGYDHMLFVTALILGAASFWDLFKVITAFTLAHSITLTLAVFNVIRLPDSIVEPMIAGSIVFVAVENIFFRERRGRLVAAFFFGLFHGLGFAGGLLEAMEGMPQTAVVMALIAFTLGVEIGHQCVVIPVYTALTLTRNKLGDATKSHEEPLDFWIRSGSALISIAGMVYLAIALGWLHL